MSTLSHLECSGCGERGDADRLQTVHACGAPWLARYELPPDLLKRGERGVPLSSWEKSLWRYRELLPVRDPAYIVSLGEGGTPLLHTARLGRELGLSRVYIKDESLNPTGSFKARGLSVAVSRAWELGVSEFVIPTAGNAGGALAAYTARAGLKAHVFMPADAPAANIAECRRLGADLHLVDGLISDAGRLAAAAAQAHGWFDISTLKEPYRVEGKKTMGYELAEDLGWRVPDVVLWPTGGGTGLIGLWKAFEEMAALGWVEAKQPRMVSVQAAGCAPVVRAFHAGADRCEPWQDARTDAAGLRVPKPFADQLILRILRETGGTAIAVSDAEIEAAQRDLAHYEGILAAPEGAAGLAALRRLRREGWVDEDETVALFNTGSGHKYLRGT